MAAICLESLFHTTTITQLAPRPYPPKTITNASHNPRVEAGVMSPLSQRKAGLKQVKPSEPGANPCPPLPPPPSWEPRFLPGATSPAPPRAARPQTAPRAPTPPPSPPALRVPSPSGQTGALPGCACAPPVCHHGVSERLPRPPGARPLGTEPSAGPPPHRAPAPAERETGRGAIRSAHRASSSDAFDPSGARLLPWEDSACWKGPPQPGPRSPPPPGVTRSLSPLQSLKSPRRTSAVAEAASLSWS